MRARSEGPMYTKTVDYTNQEELPRCMDRTSRIFQL